MLTALYTALHTVLHTALMLVWQLHHALVDRWGLLEKSFEQGDKNHDGCLSVAEFCTALRQVNRAACATAVYDCCLLLPCTAAAAVRTYLAATMHKPEHTEHRKHNTPNRKAQ